MNNLDRVTCTIVNELGNVGLYHYNKLTYLLEYLFIKNFGMRYTEEIFIKLPHGPVIRQYKAQIENLVNIGLISTDLNLLRKKRFVDDFNNIKVLISKTSKTHTMNIEEINVYILLQAIIKKYAKLPENQLEQIIYNTEPVRKYEGGIKMGFKKLTGGYVLKDCIKISDFKNTKNNGRKLALEHIQKYPKVNFELQKKFAEETSDLISMRPQID